MERRFLPTVYDRGKRAHGAFCTRWEGWVYPSDLRDKITHRGDPQRISKLRYSRYKVPVPPGVYAFLYHPSRSDDSKSYVLYIRVAGKDVVKESNQAYKRFVHHWDGASIAVVFASLPTVKQADKWEYHLIRYYSPPWNTRYAKQGRKPTTTRKVEGF